MEIAGMLGHAWPRFTAQQARGTQDVLWLVGSPTFALLLPGYLKHLGDRADADVMAHALPSLLLTIHGREGEGNALGLLTPEQRETVAEMFRTLTKSGIYADEPVTADLHRRVAHVYRAS